ncbi:MAG: HAD-IC family P-type ATPase, partial [Clostridia bacterium]|nr:HAD-IC family P-type ATPase [Clostridia bacterium]
GHGIRALYEGRSVLIGNALLMAADGIEVQAEDAVGTTLYLAVDRHLAGVFHIRDEIKDKTVEGLARLRHLGIEKFVMLSGDKKEIAESVGNNLGVDDVYYELLPEDKLTLLERLLAEDERVIFVGDGINDAPVLSRADVGIAMGRLGSDVAVESADVVLMTDEITAIADGIEVSRFTGQIIVQNIVMALGIKLGIMLLGTFGYATLWMAIFGDVGVAMMAILNSSRPVYKVTRA